MSQKFICIKHPKYQIKRKPKMACPACQALWNNRKDLK